MKTESNATRIFKANKLDPFNRITERNLRLLASLKSDDEMISNLKKYGQSYAKRAAYTYLLTRSTLKVNTFLKFMLAAGITEFTLTISKGEIEEINQTIQKE